jgi:hypothetical protein
VRQPLVFTLDPRNLPFWLPVGVAKQLGVSRAQRLTPEQYEGRGVQELIERRKRKIGDEEEEA